MAYRPPVLPPSRVIHEVTTLPPRDFIPWNPVAPPDPGIFKTVTDSGVGGEAGYLGFTLTFEFGVPPAAHAPLGFGYYADYRLTFAPEVEVLGLGGGGNACFKPGIPDGEGGEIPTPEWCMIISSEGAGAGHYIVDTLSFDLWNPDVPLWMFMWKTNGIPYSGMGPGVDGWEYLNTGGQGELPAHIVSPVLDFAGPTFSGPCDAVVIQGASNKWWIDNLKIRLKIF